MLATKDVLWRSWNHRMAEQNRAKSIVLLLSWFGKIWAFCCEFFFFLINSSRFKATSIKKKSQKLRTSPAAPGDLDSVERPMWVCMIPTTVSVFVIAKSLLDVKWYRRLSLWGFLTYFVLQRALDGRQTLPRGERGLQIESACLFTWNLQLGLRKMILITYKKAIRTTKLLTSRWPLKDRGSLLSDVFTQPGSLFCLVLTALWGICVTERKHSQIGVL